MKDWPLYWIRDAFGYLVDALDSVGWCFLCLWWALSSWINYIWLIKIRHEVE